MQWHFEMQFLIPLQDFDGPSQPHGQKGEDGNIAPSKILISLFFNPFKTYFPYYLPTISHWFARVYRYVQKNKDITFYLRIVMLLPSMNSFISSLVI